LSAASNAKDLASVSAFRRRLLEAADPRVEVLPADTKRRSGAPRECRAPSELFAKAEAVVDEESSVVPGDYPALLERYFRGDLSSGAANQQTWTLT